MGNKHAKSEQDRILQTDQRSFGEETYLGLSDRSNRKHISGITDKILALKEADTVVTTQIQHSKFVGSVAKIVTKQ